MARVQTGLDRFLASPPPAVRGRRVGLLCNPASVAGDLRHASIAVGRHPRIELTALFSPQHGFFSEKQDNMVESGDSVHRLLRIPVFSLYGETRVPTEAMFDHLDVLVVDLQDVGTRVYTFVTTMAYCMETAARLDREVVVLDRPNPIGGIQVEGNRLDPSFSSFVGKYPIPMRHGMTLAELARMFNEQFGIGCRLTVIAMEGWRRDMVFADTGLTWIAPSPNMPSPATAAVYPGQVVWEGTNVSEGRGTTQPFELFGAPFIDPEAVAGLLPESTLSGVILRPTAFEPTFHKWKGKRCHGFQLHPQRREAFRPCRTALALLWAVRTLYPDRFEWKPPPYEYEYEKMPVDLIFGDDRIRRRIDDGLPVEALSRGWEEDEAEFDRLRRPYLLYR
ncbi:MAG: DUF1343 domain-containing protein [Desulfobacterales bacterium]|jgi:uncharacterized protein YbbC (DUF1343 family)